MLCRVGIGRIGLECSCDDSSTNLMNFATVATVIVQWWWGLETRISDKKKPRQAAVFSSAVYSGGLAIQSGFTVFDDFRRYEYKQLALVVFTNIVLEKLANQWQVTKERYLVTLLDA